MSLQELEAVQHKMAAKLKQAQSFTSGEQFLDLAPSPTQQLPDGTLSGQSTCRLLLQLHILLVKLL